MITRHATENWTALLNKEGRGVGLHVPNQYRFVTGFFGTSSTGTEYDSPTSYEAATPLMGAQNGWRPTKASRFLRPTGRFGFGRFLHNNFQVRWLQQ